MLGGVAVTDNRRTVAAGDGLLHSLSAGAAITIVAPALLTWRPDTMVRRRGSAWAVTAGIVMAKPALLSSTFQKCHAPVRVLSPPVSILHHAGMDDLLLVSTLLERKMLSKLVITAAILGAGTAALAHDLSNVARTVPLQDGTSVYIFQDGKMAMEDKFGRSVSMTEGQAMVTRDGQLIRMAGNETARLDCIRRMQIGGA